MTNRQLDEEAIFHVARNIDKLETRSQYLDQICAGDLALKERVLALLDVDQRESEFLKSNAQPAPTVEFQASTEAEGQEFGRYKLREKLGEGGFGIVWAAEQAKPVRRKVALKIIKPGMDSRDVVARFEAERQALALMDRRNERQRSPGRKMLGRKMVHGAAFSYNVVLPRGRESFSYSNDSSQESFAHEKDSRPSGSDTPDSSSTTPCFTVPR